MEKIRNPFTTQNPKDREILEQAIEECYTLHFLDTVLFSHLHVQKDEKVSNQDGEDSRA